MKVSLNKANKFRHLLETAVKAQSTFFAEYHSVHLTGFETVGEAEAKLETLMNEFNVKKARFEKLVDATYELRNLIQEKNQEFGINDLISEIAKQNELLKFEGDLFQSISAGRNVTLDNYPLPQLIAQNALAMNEKADPTSRYMGRSLPYGTISIWTKDNVDIIEAELKKTKKDLMALEEKRNEKNHVNYLEIPKLVEEVLTEHDLI